MFNELFTGAKFTYNADNNEFKSVKEFLQDHDKEGTYTVRGMYISKGGQYGPQPVIILDGINLNAPKHLVEKVQMVRDSAEMVEAINEGKCGLKFYDYDKDGKTYTSITFVDI